MQLSRATRFIVLLACSLIPLASFSQASSFAIAYGGTSTDVGGWLEINTAGDYIQTGYSYSYGAGLDDIYVIEVNKTSAAVNWSRAYGTANSDRPGSIRQTADGGYIVCGYTEIANANFDELLLKLDASGNLTWARNYGGSVSEVSFSARQTSDGGYIVVGYTAQYTSTLNLEMHVIKTDSSGNLQWDKSYGVSGFFGDQALDVIELPGQKYLIMGQTSGPGVTDVALVKINSTGTVAWSYKYNFNNFDQPWGLAATSDEGFIVTGYTGNGGNEDIFVLKTDSAGSVQWAKTYGDPSSNRGWSVIQTADGGYAISGTSIAFLTGEDIYILKLDGSGNFSWLNMMGTTDGELVEGTIRQTSDAGYIIGGFGCPNNTGLCEHDYLMYKTDDQGDILGACNLTVPTFTTNTPSVGAVVITLQSQSFAVVDTPSIAITSPNTQNVVLCGPPLLPVEFTDFTAEATGGGILLQWQTAYESNGIEFEVERELQRSFERIAALESTGALRALRDYQFLDTHPTQGMNYYRLKHIDRDSAFTYSRIVGVEWREELTFEVAPNPADQFISVIMNPHDAEPVELTIMDPLGRVLIQFVVAGSPSVQVPVSALPDGAFFVRVQANGSVGCRPFVIQ